MLVFRSLGGGDTKKTQFKIQFLQDSLFADIQKQQVTMAGLTCQGAPIIIIIITYWLHVKPLTLSLPRSLSAHQMSPSLLLSLCNCHFSCFHCVFTLTIIRIKKQLNYVLAWRFMNLKTPKRQLSVFAVSLWESIYPVTFHFQSVTFHCGRACC